MSLFEFVTVMVSIILALCLGHILRAMSHIAKTQQKVVFYLPHTLWSLLLLLSVINHWWSLWDLRDLAWSYASFLYILAAPILISFASGVLIPEETDSRVLDLETHYLKVRRVFFVTMIAYGIFMFFDGPLFSGQALFGGVSIFSFALIAVTVVPVLTANRRINAACGAVALIMLLSVMVVRYATA